jgi:hypothetical protein
MFEIAVYKSVQIRDSFPLQKKTFASKITTSSMKAD